MVDSPALRPFRSNALVFYVLLHVLSTESSVLNTLTNVFFMEIIFGYLNYEIIWAQSQLSMDTVVPIEPHFWILSAGMVLLRETKNSIMGMHAETV